MQLEDIIDKAKSLGSYFIAITTRDTSKEEGNLTHYAIQQEFPVDDIIGSVDACLRSMKKNVGIQAKTIIPEIIKEKRKPLKVAILSHCSSMPSSYSPGNAIKSQIKQLQKFGHEVVFFTQVGSKLEKEDIGCEVRHLVSRFRREKGIVNEEAKKEMIDMLRRELTIDFDIIITQDYYIDDCATYRQALKECGVNLPFLHFCRSGIGTPIDFKMENSKYVYLNQADSKRFADKIGIDQSLVRFVPNEKDISRIYNFDPITTMIIEKMKLYEKDIIQTYSFCTTRMDAKQINMVIRIFGLLKGMGYRVGLVFTNSNGRKRVDEIKNKIKFAEECGLVNEEDFIFTSTLANDEFKIESELPNRCVVQLFQISNLCILPTLAEVCSNIELESSMGKNLLVVNSDCLALLDFVDDSAVIKYPFTSLQNIHNTGRDDESLKKLCKEIVGQLMSNKADRQFRRIFREHNTLTVYKKYLEPVLYEDIK
jgi:hypothetical protein